VSNKLKCMGTGLFVLSKVFSFWLVPLTFIFRKIQIIDVHFYPEVF